MKLYILLLFTTLSLNADYFGLYSNSKKESSPINKFRATYSYSNALVKKGDLAKYPQYRSTFEKLQKSLNTLDISKNEKRNLKKNMRSYAKIINALYKSMKKNTPNIYAEYKQSRKGFLSCNNGIESTGYAPLLNVWHDLIKIKHNYIRRPSYALSKKFDKKWGSVKYVLTDLCLDEDIETPLLNYLNLYKKYFDELDNAYDSVEYSNVRKIKPLSYAIKANLEFATSQQN